MVVGMQEDRQDVEVIPLFLITNRKLYRCPRALSWRAATLLIRHEETYLSSCSDPGAG